MANPQKIAKQKEWVKANPDKVKAIHKRYRDAHKEQNKFRDLKRRYGISKDEYETLFEKQGGVCAICRHPQTGRKKLLDVDHDHVTGKVRGLLCNPHNRALGIFNDDLRLMATAMQYLERSSHAF